MLSLVLISIQWLPYQPGSNFNGETGLIIPSLAGGWRPFVYLGDPTRVFTATPYHLGYLINEGLGLRGSPIGYQLLYLVLWVARPVLIGIILIRGFKAPVPVGLLGAAVASTFGGDDATNWIGQLNQHWFLALALLSATLMLIAFERAWSTTLAAAAAAVAAFLALWSYEGVLPVLMVTLVAALLLPRRWRPRSLLPIALVGGVVLASLVVNARRYLDSATTSYQESVARTDWSIGAIASDFAGHFRNTLEFWNWGPDPGVGEVQAWMVVLALAAAVVAAVVLGAAFIDWGRSLRGTETREPGSMRAKVLLIAWSLGIGVLGAAPYMALADGPSPWRKQFTMGVALALLVAGVAWVITPMLARRSVVVASIAVSALGLLVALAVFYGVRATTVDGQRFSRGWETQEAFVRSLVAAAPCVRPGTVLFISQDPGKDAFGHQMWLNHALQLAYRNTPRVSAAYNFTDGRPGPGLDGVAVYTGSAPGERRPWVALREGPDGVVRLVDRIPPDLLAASKVTRGEFGLTASCHPKDPFSVRMFGLES